MWNECLAAIQAALANKLQRTMNIALGSALATMGLTIPAVLTIGLVTGKRVELGLENAEAYLLLITLLVSVVNFNSERTNRLQGIVHLTLFFTYIVLIFDWPASASVVSPSPWRSGRPSRTSSAA